jgi:cytochrome c oxidase cbb3-type subunit 3
MSANHDDTRDNRADYRQNTVMGHEYDGIQEFDNRLPNWWMWIMWGSIVFALGYWLVFHTLSLKPLPVEEFETVMQKAQEEQLARAAAQGVDDNFLVMMSQTNSKVAEGRELYVRHCAACHLDKGQGLIGPNLTDDVWVHGCAPMAIHKVLVDGVAAKGMPAWQNQLGPARVHAVVAYLLTIKGTNVPGKAPEGEPCQF